MHETLRAQDFKQTAWCTCKPTNTQIHAWTGECLFMAPSSYNGLKNALCFLILSNTHTHAGTQAEKINSFIIGQRIQFQLKESTVDFQSLAFPHFNWLIIIKLGTRRQQKFYL